MDLIIRFGRLGSGPNLDGKNLTVSFWRDLPKLSGHGENRLGSLGQTLLSFADP